MFRRVVRQQSSVGAFVLMFRAPTASHNNPSSDAILLNQRRQASTVTVSSTPSQPLTTTGTTIAAPPGINKNPSSTSSPDPFGEDEHLPESALRPKKTNHSEGGDDNATTSGATSIGGKQGQQEQDRTTSFTSAGFQKIDSTNRANFLGAIPREWKEKKGTGYFAAGESDWYCHACGQLNPEESPKCSCLEGTKELSKSKLHKRNNNYASNINSQASLSQQQTATSTNVVADDPSATAPQHSSVPPAEEEGLGRAELQFERDGRGRGRGEGRGRGRGRGRGSFGGGGSSGGDGSTRKTGFVCACGASNFEGRTACYKCQTPAPEVLPGVDPAAQPKSTPSAGGDIDFVEEGPRRPLFPPKSASSSSAAPISPTTAASSSAAGAAAASADKWECHACKNKNAPRRNTCFKCGRSKK